MKFIVCILALYGVALALRTEHNAFGITKPSSVVVKELAEAVNRILGNVGYIQFYDVVKKVDVFPIHPEVTLSGIEMSGVNFTTKLDPAQLAYTVDGATAFIKGNALSWAVSADLSMKWSYKVGGAVIYRGTYTAKLKTSGPLIEFNFTDGTTKTGGKINFNWILENPSVKGFGAYEMVIGHINGLLKELLFPRFNEEMNRYNDVIVASIVYNQHYRDLQIPLPDTFKDKASIKNTLSKIILLHAAGTEHMTFVFSSAIYFAIEHKEYPFDGSFEIAEDLTSDKIVLYFGINQMSQLFEKVKSALVPKAFVITPEIQENLLHYKLNIAWLSTFYPKLSEEYNPDELIELACSAVDTAEATKEYTFNCRFVLSKDHSTVVFDIATLKWELSFSLAPTTNDPTNKGLKFALKGNKFTNIAISKPLVPIYVAKQLMSMMQPLAKYEEYSKSFTVQIVGKDSNWNFDNAAYNDKGDLTISYVKA